MKKVFLVIHELGIINDVLKDRIRSLGRSYVFWNNHWLVETDLTAEEIYHRIACDIFERQAFFIVEITNKSREGYWGIMNRTLWKWLKNE
ncbi:hypothetical protein [Odoribacter sp. Z80]|jgi:hypothetical protein|uniref:hypothetical protein n=1 Tax=Odoribacter sp. Z80 TaxID=2304575 RepID=UPI0013796C02|nr:hypothetical protein [Odoribacter sp. Z80]NCE72429.1 hypothetical protein [Odoribacter sp. Z80]